MGEGIIFPSCNTLLAAWTPLKERSITATVVYSGGMLGSIFGSSISGLLISNFGWTSVFYSFGAVAVIWCIVFVSNGLVPFMFHFYFSFLILLSALFVLIIPSRIRS